MIFALAKSIAYKMKGMTTPNKARIEAKDTVWTRQISEQNGAPEHILKDGIYFVQLRTPSRDVSDLINVSIHATVELNSDIRPPYRKWEKG